MPPQTDPTENPNAPCSHDDSDIPILLDPARDDPAAHFTYQGHFLIARTNRAEETRRVCGLDREALNDAREAYLVVVEMAILAYELAKRHGNMNERRDFAASLLHFAFSPTASYKAMARARIADAGIDVDDLKPLL